MNIPRKKKRSPLSRIAPWALVALAVIFVAGFITFRIWFYGYLRSPAFCNLIGGITSKQLKANGNYLPFSFSDGAIFSDGFKAQGTDEAAFTDLRADQLRAVINLSGLWKHAWQIDEINVQRFQVTVGHAGETETAAVQPEQVPQESYAVPSMPGFKWLPNHVDLRKVVIHDTNVKWGDNTPRPGGINGAEVTITPDNSNSDNPAWNIVCDSGTISQQGEPDVGIDQATLRYQGGTLYITDAGLRYSSDSNIDLSGEVNFGTGFDMQAKLSNIPITPLLQPDWRAKLKGKLNGTVKISSLLPMTAGPQVDGDLSLADGELEALPVLDEIATFTSTERFRRVSLTRVTAHFTRSDAMINVTNFIAESEGLICVKGGFTVQNGFIDGNFNVGITPSSMQWMPAALQNRVFTASHDGYLWTPMHLSGPVNNPSEDLSKRLASALIDAGVDTAKGIIDQVPGASTVTGEGKKLFDDVLSPLTGK